MKPEVFLKDDKNNAVGMFQFNHEHDMIGEVKVNLRFKIIDDNGADLLNDLNILIKRYSWIDPNLQ